MYQGNLKVLILLRGTIRYKPLYNGTLVSVLYKGLSLVFLNMEVKSI